MDNSGHHRITEVKTSQTRDEPAKVHIKLPIYLVIKISPNLFEFFWAELGKVTEASMLICRLERAVPSLSESLFRGIFEKKKSLYQSEK
jgi:hypothetical protein